jgi:glycosyltransferase involved in cell wall biosynthesis
MTIVEALSAGLPVVASRIGSLAEIVREGVVGRQFATGDSNELAKTVNELATTPVALIAMGEAARHDYETHYTPTQGLQALEAIYQAALGEAARSR